MAETRHGVLGSGRTQEVPGFGDDSGRSLLMGTAAVRAAGVRAATRTRYARVHSVIVACPHALRSVARVVAQARRAGGARAAGGRSLLLIRRQPAARAARGGAALVCGQLRTRPSLDEQRVHPPSVAYFGPSFQILHLDSVAQSDLLECWDLGSLCCSTS